jgi:hypothetical protein
LWLNFHAIEPFALKIYVGGVNAISGVPVRESPEAKAKSLGKEASKGSGMSSLHQDYVVLPEQRWLDGIATEYGKVKQFVSMPKGSGYSVEAQVTGEEQFSGIQFEITPVKRRCPDVLKVRFETDRDQIVDLRAHGLSDMSTLQDLKKVLSDISGISVEKQITNLDDHRSLGRVTNPTPIHAIPQIMTETMTFQDICIPTVSVNPL